MYIHPICKDICACIMYLYVYIGSCVKIDHQTYSVRENLILQVTLSLSLIASYDIGLNIHCVDLNASELSIRDVKKFKVYTY